MAKEIERKFLVASQDWRNAADGGTEFRQAYIVTMEDRSVRIRTFDGQRAQLTLKIGKTALVRDEYEYDIDIEDAESMLSKAIGIVIDKTRFRVPHEGFVWEVDVYAGALAGLVVAEVELADENDMPPLPAWLGRELTGDTAYSNQTLALEGIPDSYSQSG